MYVHARVQSNRKESTLTHTSVCMHGDAYDACLHTHTHKHTVVAAINERQRRLIRPVEVYEFVDFLLLSEVPRPLESSQASVLY